MKKNHVSSYRPTGRLDPAPADLAYGFLALAALELPSFEDDGMWWRRDPAAPVLFAGVSTARGARTTGHAPACLIVSSDSIGVL